MSRACRPGFPGVPLTWMRQHPLVQTRSPQWPPLTNTKRCPSPISRASPSAARISGLLCLRGRRRSRSSSATATPLPTKRAVQPTCRPASIHATTPSGGKPVRRVVGRDPTPEGWIRLPLSLGRSPLRHKSGARDVRADRRNRVSMLRAAQQRHQHDISAYCYRQMGGLHITTGCWNAAGPYPCTPVTPSAPVPPLK